MLLSDYLDMNDLQEQIASGMIKEQPHPTDSLAILNYTQRAQFTPEAWTVTTDKCRGLIYDPTSGEIVSRPMVKFWNFGDQRHPETLPENLPSGSPIITAKMDGSLGIGYRCSGGYSIATRGSFSSDQAQWATKWIRANALDEWPDGYTPLFEIIYAENQIVVKYDFEGLVLLALVNNESGEEVDQESLRFWGEKNGINVVDFSSLSLDECAKLDLQNEEGFVALWPRQGTYPLRVKVKYDTYCRLHKLLTQTSTVSIWEMLRDGQDIQTLTSDVPAEFTAWIRSVELCLRAEYGAIEASALRIFEEYDGEKIIVDAAQKKAFALYAITKQPLTPILFAIVEKKAYANIIWKMIRPKGNMPFKADVDG